LGIKNELLGHLKIAKTLKEQLLLYNSSYNFKMVNTAALANNIKTNLNEIKDLKITILANQNVSDFMKRLLLIPFNFIDATINCLQNISNVDQINSFINFLE
jgi:hypothetical protein